MTACCKKCGYGYEKQFNCRCWENEIEELKSPLRECRSVFRQHIKLYSQRFTNEETTISDIFEIMRAKITATLEDK